MNGWLSPIPAWRGRRYWPSVPPSTGRPKREELPNLTPSWRLKAIPRVDGRGADVLQLIDGAKVTSDVDVHVCRAGDGVVQLDPSPIYNLADFTPREYYGAYYLEQDYTEGYGEVVHDFLNPA